MGTSYERAKYLYQDGDYIDAVPLASQAGQQSAGDETLHAEIQRFLNTAAHRLSEQSFNEMQSGNKQAAAGGYRVVANTSGVSADLQQEAATQLQTNLRGY